MSSTQTDVKQAIHAGDADRLRTLLAAEPSSANALIRWGRNDCIETHPLHYVSDAIFEGLLDRVKAVALVDALIDAGAEVDFHKPGKGETPLMGAASLGAEEVGLRLLDAGAAVGIRGLFDETPLHWAANMGLHRLVRRLIEAAADVNAEDRKYQSSPLGWALHGWMETPAEERRGRHDEVVRQLVAAGAQVKGEWLESKEIQARPEVIGALTSG
jgi:uncharacterized protein